MTFNIRTKLLLAFAALIVLTALVGWIGLSEVSTINDRATDSYADDLIGTGDVATIVEDTLLVRTDVLAAIVTTEASADAALRADIAKRDQSIDSTVAALRARDTDGAQRAALDRFVESWSNYVKVRDDVTLPADAAGNSAQALAAYNGEDTSRFNAVNAASNALVQSFAQSSADNNDANAVTFNEARLLTLGVTALAVLIGIGLALLLARTIAQAARQVAGAAQGLARGELDQQIAVRSRDELGQMADALRQMIGYQERMAAAADSFARGELLDDVRPLSEKDVFGTAFQRMSQYQRQMAGVADAIARGDLSAAVAPQSAQDVFGVAFQRMSANLRITLQELGEVANVLAAAAAEILATTNQIAAAASETASAVSETTATVEQARQTAQLSSHKAHSVAESVQRSEDVAQMGTRAVEETRGGMDRIRVQMASIADSIVRLSEQRQAIGDIMTSVNDLAEQSNLLAVNAAIEAAKAGEQGRGFAVVAQEVKRLAEQSKQATGLVRGILNDIQKATTAAVMATEQGGKAVEAGIAQSTGANEAIRVLAESAYEATQAATQIEVSSQQQLIGMEQIALAMGSIKEASAQNVASTRQAASSAQGLHEMGQKLKLVVAQYKL